MRGIVVRGPSSFTDLNVKTFLKRINMIGDKTVNYEGKNTT